MKHASPKSMEAFRQLWHSRDPDRFGLAMRWNEMVLEFSADTDVMDRLKADPKARELQDAVLEAETVDAKAKAIRRALKGIPKIAAGGQ